MWRTRTRKVTSECHRLGDGRSVSVSPAVAVCVLFSVIESEEFDDEEDDDEEDVVAEEEDDDDDDDSEDDEVSRAACLCQAFRGKLLPRQMQFKLQEKHLKSCNRIWD